MRASYLLALGLTASVVPDAAAQAESGQSLKPPNLLVIFTDDQSWRTLSCYKDDGAWSWVRTPHIDRLAAEGVRFTHGYGAAWCTPSRACLLTGLHLHGIPGLQATDVHKISYDPKVCRFWPAELRKGGYDTALIGKWHLGADTGHGCDWVYSVVWDQGQSRGDQYNDQLLSINGGPRQEVPGYSTDLYTQFALDHLKQEHRKPWLLWLCYNAPHMEWAVAERHRDRYRDAEVSIPAAIFGPRQGKPGYLEKLAHWKPGKGDNERMPQHARTGQPLADMVRSYNRTICALDEGIGRIYETLEKTGQLGNTAIVFTSDQGFAWGDHGFATKLGPYDACLRVPFIVRLPGKAARGQVCRHPVGLIDVPPTLFALAGLKTPWTMHGHDLGPLLKDPEAKMGHQLLTPVFSRKVLAHPRGWSFGPGRQIGLAFFRLSMNVLLFSSILPEFPARTPG